MSTDHEYKIQLSRMPGIDINLKRINIFLGVNGSGKSNILKEIKGKSNQFKSKSVIFIEGGRTIKVIDSLALDSNTYSRYSSVDAAKTNHKTKHTANLSDRVKDALLLINVLGNEVGLNHSKAVKKWQAEGEKGKSPICDQPPLEKLFSLFTEIFPSITLEYNDNKQTMSCTKYGKKYSPSLLSDGEKQVFSLLADIVILGGDNRLVVVDEPELNLNPGLANRFWDLVENELTDSVFIYATHSVSFSMRASVEKIYILNNQDSDIAEIKNIKEIDDKELPALLGSIPAILSSSSTVVVEGKESSIDTTIYRWLVKQKDTEIVAVGGCEEVQAIVNKTGVWDRLTTSGVSILGVIDRDFKSQKTLDHIDKSNCITLDYHEIESYLCHPNVAIQVAKGMGAEKPPTEQKIKDLITAAFNKELLQIVARRVFARSTIRLGVSIEKNLLKNINDQGTLEQTLVQAATNEVFKATNELSPDTIKAIAQEELNTCRDAIKSGSIDKMLSLIPAKSLVEEIAHLVGCKNGSSYARAATKHVKVDEIPKLHKLQDALNKPKITESIALSSEETKVA